MCLRKLLPVFFSLACFIQAFAAEKKEPDENAPSRAVNNKGIGVSLGGPGGLYTVSGDYYITPNIDIELGGSFYPQVSSPPINMYFAHVGIKYAFLGHWAGQRWSPYIGVMPLLILFSGDVTFYQGNSSFSLTSSTEKVIAPLFSVYFPVGIELIAYNGITFGFELAYVYAPSQTVTLTSKNLPGASYTVTSLTTSIGWAGLKLGYHF